MKRARAILLGWFLVSLAEPPAAWGVTTTEGTDGPQTAGSVQKDATTISAAHPAGQARCKESAKGYTMISPSGQTVVMNPCATGTWSTTDIIPPPLYFLPGNLTGTGTGTATASTTATSTGTLTVTATVTGTFTASGTGTITGTGTHTATGYATLTKTATGTVTVTVTGTGSGTSTVTETNASIGNASAAPGLLSIGTSGQTQFDASGNEVSSGTLSMTGAGTVADFGGAARTISLGAGTTTPFLGFNARIGGANIFSYGRGSAGNYAGGLEFIRTTGAFVFVGSGVTGWDGQTFTPQTLLTLGRDGSLTAQGNLFGANMTPTPTAFFIPEALSTGLLDPGWIPPVTQLASSTGSVTVNTSAPTAATQACVTTGSGATASCTWQSVLVGNGVSGSAVTACDYLNGQCTATKTATTTGTLYAGPGMNFTVQTGTGTATVTATSAALSNPITINVTSTSTATSTATSLLAFGAGLAGKTNTTTSTYTSCTLPGPCTIVQTGTATGTNTFTWSNASKSSGANGLTTATAALNSSDITAAGGLATNGVSGTANYPAWISYTDGQITGAGSGPQPDTGSGTAGYFPYTSSPYNLTASSLRYSAGDLVLGGSFSPATAYSYTLGNSSYPWLRVYTSNFNLGGVEATAVGGTANAPVVSDGSGTVNSWVTGRTSTGSASNSGGNVVSDSGGTWTPVSSVSINPSVASTVIAQGVATITASTITTCYLRIVYDSANAFGPPDVRIATSGSGYTPLFDVARTTGISGSHTIDLQVKSITSSTCTVPQYMGNLVVQVVNE